MATNQTQEIKAKGKDYVAHLMEDIGKLVEDVRHVIDEGIDEKSLRKQEKALRGALGKAREYLKAKMSKHAGNGHAAGPEERRAEPDKELPSEEAHEKPQAAEEQGERKVSAEFLQHALDGLSKATESLRSVEHELKSALGSMAEKPEGAIRSAFGKAKRVFQKAEKKEEEQAAPQPQGEEKGQEQQAAPPPQGDVSAEAHAAPQPEGAQPEGGREERQARSQPREGVEVVDLFDGTEDSYRPWKLVGPGSIEQGGGELRIKASGGDRGLVYYTSRRFDDFKLSFKFRPDSPDCRMNAAVRFLDPEQPVPDRDDPSVQYPYDNPAFVAVHTGFEVQLGPQRPGSRPGTIDGVLIGDAPGAQRLSERGEIKVGEWNDVEIDVHGNDFIVHLNGNETAWLRNADSFRGKPSSADPHAGFVGLVLRSGSASLRDVRAEIRPAEAEKEQESSRPSIASQQDEQQPHGH